MSSRLLTNKRIQTVAQQHHFGVGAFNVFDMESIQAVVRAAELERSPAIIATTEGAIEYAGHEFLAEMISLAAKRSDMPLTMHLDHGKDMKIIRDCIKFGYSSVMIDASHYPWEKNIQVTKKVVDMCHKKGMSVEAELGTIGGVEDKVSTRHIILTEPGEAKEFAQRTGCDTLAVAIGTSHGAYKFAGKSRLDIKRLREIKKVVKIPLVLHGASGIPQDIVRKAERFGAKLGRPHGVSVPDTKAAIRNGISKINIDSDLRLTFDAAIREVLSEKPDTFDPRKILGPARDALVETVRMKMRMFSSSGKAKYYKK
ncbi:TPA: class II fructose-bisphosphate aldolase family protein [Candidatus Woesearchaeota archaeon]|nr:class II fructose-bisphosphate aldolase family protein [Candidatus Woesearchaeota archaeon]